MFALAYCETLRAVVPDGRRGGATKDDATLNRIGADWIHSRQVDEQIGLARGLIADGAIKRPNNAVMLARILLCDHS